MDTKGAGPGDGVRACALEREMLAGAAGAVPAEAETVGVVDAAVPQVATCPDPTSAPGGL
jgi:hypothetical protein